MTTINKSVDNSSDQLYQCKMWCELSGYFAVVKYDLPEQHMPKSTITDCGIDMIPFPHF